MSFPLYNCSDFQEFMNIKQSLNDFFSRKSDESLKDDLCTYMINIVGEYKKSKNDARNEKPTISDYLEELKNYDDPIFDETAEFVILPKKKKYHNIDLLNEIWRRIFSYLPTNDILGKIARVCKRFNEITKDPTLLQYIKLKNITDYESDYVFKVLERSKCLGKLSIIDCDNYKDILFVTLKSNSNLKTLILCHHRRDEEELCDVEAVGIIAEKGKNLENLYVRMTASNSALKQIASITQLKTLHIQNANTIIYPEVIEEMANNYTKLENFHVKFKDFDQIEMLSGHIQRRIMKLGEMKAAMKSFFQKQKTLKKFTFRCDSMFSTTGLLEAIDLSQELEYFNAGDPSAYPMNKAEMEALSRLRKLKSLTIRINPKVQMVMSRFGIDAPPFDVNATFNSFMTNACFEELQYLDLSHNEDLTNENLETLSKRNLPKLLVLSLNFCSQVILNNSMLEKLVRNSPKLMHLQLVDVKVGEVSDELFYKLQMQHILVTMDSEKEDSVEKYIKYNIPSSEHPRSKLFLNSLVEKMAQPEELNFKDFY